MVQFFAQGHDVESTARQVNATPYTVRMHLQRYQKGGLEAVVEPIRTTQPSRLCVMYL